MSKTKILKDDFVEETLSKIERVLNMILEHHNVYMKYDINDRNKLFCELLKQTKKDLTSVETFKKIQEKLWTHESIDTGESEWLSQQIFDYNQDVFILHYFYAVLYSYNYDIELREKVTEEHVKKFFYKANEIYKKYKELKKSDAVEA